MAIHKEGYQMIFRRLREPSTWAGLSALALFFGLPVAVVPIIAKVGGVIGAVGAVLLPENAQ